MAGACDASAMHTLKEEKHGSMLRGEGEKNDS